jgi:hypothetical protein
VWSLSASYMLWDARTGYHSGKVLYEKHNACLFLLIFQKVALHFTMNPVVTSTRFVIQYQHTSHPTSNPSQPETKPPKKGERHASFHAMISTPLHGLLFTCAVPGLCMRVKWEAC